MIKKDDPRLTSFVLGELDAAELAEIQAAIDGSAELKQEVDNIRAMVGQVDQHFAEEVQIGLSKEQRHELDSINSDESDVVTQSRADTPGLKRWLTLAIAAGLIGLLATLAYPWLSEQLDQPNVAKNDIELRGGNNLPGDLDFDSKDSPEEEIHLDYVVPNGEGDGHPVENPDWDDALEAVDEASLEDIPQGESSLSGNIEFKESLELPEDLEELVSFNRNAQGQQGQGQQGQGQPDRESALADFDAELPDANEWKAKRASRSKFAKIRPSLEPSETPYFLDLDESKSAQTRFSLFETRTRSVPGTRTRTEVRTRQVPVRRVDEDGREHTEMVSQSYTVSVPYTENVSQSYAVIPESADKLALELKRRIEHTGDADVFFRVEGKELEIQLVENGKDKVQLKGEKLERVEEMFEALWKETGINDPESALRMVAPELNKALKRTARQPKPKTWKRVKAVPNTTRLMIGDKDELDMNGMQVNVQVDGFRARVLIDCFFYNDRGRQLEGKFKLRLPDDASLYYFAFGQSVHRYDKKGKLAEDEFVRDDGTQFVSFNPSRIRQQRQDEWQNVKESRMVPREKAAFAYNQTVRRKVDPALVEWSGAGVFNASVFPLMPNQMHRIVIGYDVNLTETKDGWEYLLELPEQTGQCQVDLNVREIEGTQVSVSPKPSEQNNKLVANDDAEKLDDEGMALHSKSYRFINPDPSEPVRLIANGTKTTLLHSVSKAEGNFFAMRFTPEIPAEATDGNDKAIFLIDTSLSSRPEKFNVWLKMLQATLDNNRDSLKQFGVVFFNVDHRLWKNEFVANTPKNVHQLMDDCNQLSLEGATDLYGAFDLISKTDWIGKNVDLFLLSDGAANWGETNLQLIRGLVTDNSLGNVFAYQSGLMGTAIAKLRFLTSETGGAVFSVAEEAEIQKASTAHCSRPWRLDRIEVDGGKDIMTAGRVQSLYPGQSLTVVGRHTGEGKIGNIVLHLSQGSAQKQITISPAAEINTDLASRLFGQVAVGQLENIGQTVVDVSAAYARHFRITGETCSLLMLESEADYKRFNIKPEEDLFVIKSKEATKLIESTLKSRAAEIADPKAQLVAWINRLEKMEGLNFEVPTALKLAMDDLTVRAISKSLECEFQSKDQVEGDFAKLLGKGNLKYDDVVKEADRRATTSADDAIKVLSSLVEQNPGNLVIARDVAFAAMELGHPAQAFHLLRQVAMARPYEPSIYAALGQCLSQLGEADMAILFYEVAIAGNFQNRGSDFRKIVGTEYVHLLRNIENGKAESNSPDFAKARLETLSKKLEIGEADLVVTMMWNIDQTDVDLHIVEPSGEECFYSNPKSRSGGRMTRDIRDGFGPEMYVIKKAPRGKYDIGVKYFSTNANRIGLRGKVYLAVYQNYGRSDERMFRRTITVENVGNKQSVMTVSVGK